MYEVSEAYQAQIRKPMRNPCYVRIKFGIQHPEANRNAVFSDNGQQPYSSVPDINGESDVLYRYGTLEPGYWLLDGSLETAPEKEPFSLQGYVGTELSQETGAYEELPIVTIHFKEGYYAFRGLSFFFDTSRGEYPVQVRVIGYMDETAVFDKTLDVEDASFSYSGNVPDGEQYLNKLQLLYLDSGIPHRRARLEAVVFGVIKSLTYKDITEVKWSRKNDLMNTSIAKNELSFTFLDVEGEYNPDNPEGVWKFLEDGQEVKFDYGYELSDGTIEWVQGGTNYTDGEPTVTNSAGLSKASFHAVSRLQSLSEEYREGIYHPDGQTLYDLAERILLWADLIDDNGNKEYIITEKLKNYRTTAPLPVQEARALLQLIANAGMCIVDVNRDGIIYFDNATEQMTSFVFDKEAVLEAPPTTNKYPMLKDVQVSLYQYTPQAETTDLASLQVSAAEETTFELNFDNAATEISVNLTGSLTASHIEYYANMCRITVTGSGSIMLTGKAIDESNATVSFAYEKIGESCPVSNPLITDMEHARQYAAWVAEIVQRRAEYTFKDRGFPEIDTTDNVLVDTLFTDNIQATVTESDITYNGAFSGNTKLLVRNQ